MKWFLAYLECIWHPKRPLYPMRSNKQGVWKPGPPAVSGLKHPNSASSVAKAVYLHGIAALLKGHETAKESTSHPLKNQNSCIRKPVTSTTSWKQLKALQSHKNPKDLAMFNLYNRSRHCKSKQNVRHPSAVKNARSTYVFSRSSKELHWPLGAQHHLDFTESTSLTMREDDQPRGYLRLRGLRGVL